MLIAFAISFNHEFIIAKRVDHLTTIVVRQLVVAKSKRVVLHFWFSKYDIVALHLIFDRRHLHRIIAIHTRLGSHIVAMLEHLATTNHSIHEHIHECSLSEVDTTHCRSNMREVSIKALAFCAHIHQQFSIEQIDIIFGSETMLSHHCAITTATSDAKFARSTTLFVPLKIHSIRVGNIVGSYFIHSFGMRRHKRHPRQQCENIVASRVIASVVRQAHQATALTINRIYTKIYSH